MYVAVGIFEIRVPDSRSLKAKRAVVRSVKERLRQRLSVSVAEVGNLDSWQIARLGACYVGADEKAARNQLEKCVGVIEDETDDNLTGWSLEILPFDSSVNLGESENERLMSELTKEFTDVD